MANIPDQYKPILAKLNHLWVANFGDIMFPKESITVINTRTQQTGSVVLGGYAWFSNNNFNGGRTEETAANLMPVIEAGLGSETFIDIVGDENGVTVSYSDNIPSTSVQYNYSKYNGAYDLGYIPYEGQSIAKSDAFNSLSDCMNYLLLHWAGVTIRVNNEVWLAWDDPYNPITYNWQSVPSISGKNGILELSQAKASALNNGEPVSSASASDFDSLTAQVSTLVTDDSQMAGKEAGGISGSGDNSADQSAGNAFGQGESGTNASGGGSGLYGGYKGTSSKSGGAGSGYIGNSLISNKKMVGFNVPTSSAEGTKTESVNDVSASAVSGKPKSGNGFARIKLLSTSQDYNFTDIIKTLDMTHIKHTSGNISNLSEYYLTDWILNSGINSQQTLTYNDGVFAISDGGGIVSYPITRLNGVSKVTFKARRTNHSVSFDGCFFNVIDGVRTVVGSFSGSLNTDWKTFTVNIDNKIVDYFEVYAGGGYRDNVQISDVVFTSV